MKTAADTTRPPAGSASDWIDWRSRWKLRRQGVLDGRLRQPDPLYTTAPVRTTTRQLLESRFLEDVEKARGTFNDRIVALHNRLQELDMKVAQGQDRVDAAAADLREALDERVEVSPPTRRPGEEDVPESLVRRRRRREHNRTCDRLRQLLRQAEQALVEDRRLWAATAAEIDGLERQAIDMAYRIRATYQRAQAIYDRALLKRHPQAELLQPMLETGPFPMPSWVGRAWSSTNRTELA